MSGLSNLQASKILGVSEEAVRQQRAKGRAPLTPDGKRIDGDRIEEMRANIRPSKNPSGGSKGGKKFKTLQEADLARAQIDVEYKVLKTEELAGRLVDRQRMIETAASTATQFRDQFLAFCQREAPGAAADCGGDPGKLRRYLDKAAREELRRMSEGQIKIEPPAEDWGDDSDPVDEEL